MNQTDSKAPEGMNEAERHRWKNLNFGKNYGTVPPGYIDPLKVREPYTPEELEMAMQMLVNDSPGDVEKQLGCAHELMKDQLQRLGFTTAMEIYHNINW